MYNILTDNLIIVKFALKRASVMICYIDISCIQNFLAKLSIELQMLMLIDNYRQHVWELL